MSLGIGRIGAGNRSRSLPLIDREEDEELRRNGYFSL